MRRVVAVAVLASTGTLTVQPTASSTVSEVQIVNAAALNGSWQAELGGAISRSVQIGFVGDSNAEGQGVPAGADSLKLRMIDRLQSRMRARTMLPYCYTEPSIYHASSSLIPAWYQTSPQIASAEVPKTGVVDVDWLRDSTNGPGGRAAHLQLRASSTGAVPATGAAITFKGVFTKVDIDYYKGTWGRVLQFYVDGSLKASIPTYAEVSGFDTVPAKWTWTQPSGAASAHTVVVRVAKDPRFGAGSGIVGGFTAYDADQTRCVKVLDLSHGGFGVHFLLTQAPRVIRDNVTSGPGSRGLDLMVLELGYNDPAYYTPAQFQAALQILITRTRAHGYSGPIVLLGMPTPARAVEWKASWPEYLASMRAVAANLANKTAYLGLDGVMPAYPNGPYWADTVHLNSTGSDVVARYLSDFLYVGTLTTDRSYTALGDSFASGLGADNSQASDYELGSLASGNNCFRSIYSYGHRIATRYSLALTNLTCQGTTSKEIWDTQASQISARTRFVSVSAGGNDVGFGAAARACAANLTVSGLQNCLSALGTAEERVNDLRPVLDASGNQTDKLLSQSLDRLYSRIRAQAPYANVVVVGYPRLYAPTWSDMCGVFQFTGVANAVTVQLNARIKSRALAHGFSFVEPTASTSTWNGHELCGPAEDWINGVVKLAINKSYHPNISGHVMYFAKTVGPALTGVAW